MKKQNLKLFFLAIALFVFGLLTGGYFLNLSSSKNTLNKIFFNQPISQSVSNHPGQEYSVETKRKSFFYLDSTGKMIPENRNGKRYFKKDEKEYIFERPLYSNKTALIVMDPWLDSGDESINFHLKPVLDEKVLPLVKKVSN